MSFYSILQNFLEEKGMTVTEAARVCEIPYSTLNSIIRRKSETTTLEIALKISEGLDIPLHQLFSEEETTLIEAQLLEKFRLLNKEDQKYILQTIDLIIFKKDKDKNTPKEFDLLDSFRRLDEEGQAYMLQTMKMAVITHEKTNDPELP